MKERWGVEARVTRGPGDRDTQMPQVIAVGCASWVFGCFDGARLRRWCGARHESADAAKDHAGLAERRHPRSMNMKLRCLWDNVLVLVDRGGKEKTTAAGIVMPATAKPGHRRQGEIVAVGPGKPMFHAGTWVTRPMTVRPGQQVTFEIGAGTVFPEDDGKEYVVLVEEQITGVVDLQLPAEVVRLA